MTQPNSIQKPLVFLTLLLVFLTGIGYLFSMDAGILMVSRWIASFSLMALAWFRKSLTSWILVALVIGANFGYDYPEISLNLKVLSDIFLKLIKTIIGPLLFGTLVVGIAGHSNLKQVGRMGLKSIIYFEVVTTFALFIGLAAINYSQAGKGVTVPKTGELPELVKVNQNQTASDIILHIFPENFAKSMAEGQVLQIVVFSILFGIALAMVTGKKKETMLEFAESLSDVMFKFTNIVMYLAPFAVFGAMAFTIGKYGLDVFGNLIKLLLTLYVALFVFILLVFIPIMFIAGIPVKRFFQTISEPVTLAFATASSESALPIAMERLEQFGVPRKIVAFVLPTGYSFNLDGTTLYLSLASIFVSQAAGIHLTFGQQLLMVFTLMLTSKGVAGVPRASLVILSATVASFGLPPEPILIIMGIDAIMDMARTAVNVMGNCLAAVVVARWEGEWTAKSIPMAIETEN